MRFYHNYNHRSADTYKLKLYYESETGYNEFLIIMKNFQCHMYVDLQTVIYSCHVSSTTKPLYNCAVAIVTYTLY